MAGFHLVNMDAQHFMCLSVNPSVSRPFFPHSMVTGTAHPYISTNFSSVVSEIEKWRKYDDDDYNNGSLDNNINLI